MEQIYGIDRAAKRAGGMDKLAGVLEVPTHKLRRWRREDPQTALKRSIKAAGSQTELAARLGVAQATISMWLNKDCPPVDEVEPKNGIERAVKLAGSQAALARKLGVRGPSVSSWVHQGYAPPRRAQEIEFHYGVPRADCMSPEMRDVMGTGGDL